MLVQITARQLATVLAALRYWQHDLSENEDGPILPEHFDDCEPLTIEEIDALCERLNLGTKEAYRDRPTSRRQT